MGYQAQEIEFALANFQAYQATLRLYSDQYLYTNSKTACDESLMCQDSSSDRITLEGVKSR